MNGKAWSKEDEKLLKNIISTEKNPYDMASKTFLRSRSAIRGKVYSLHLKTNFFFTEEEYEIIKKRYPTEGSSKDLQKTINRSAQSIESAARRLGIRTDSDFRRKFRGENSPLYKGYKEISGKYLKNIKSCARSRKLEYLVSPEYLWELYIKQNRKCVFSGLEIQFGCGYINPIETTASLDRIDSSKGYIEGNLQWVHKDINRMKWHFSDKNFIKYCCIIAKHCNCNDLAKI